MEHNHRPGKATSGLPGRHPERLTWEGQETKGFLLLKGVSQKTLSKPFKTFKRYNL